jgi:hypothetical protein
VRSPANTEEQTVWDAYAEAYHAKREKAYKDELRVNRYFLWVAVLFCMICLFLCWFGFSVFVEQNRDLNHYIAHETVLSEQRNQREILKFKQDSISMSARDKREIAKDKRDSLSWVRHNKQMDRYDKLPDYKNESK